MQEVVWCASSTAGVCRVEARPGTHLCVLQGAGMEDWGLIGMWDVCCAVSYVAPIKALLVRDKAQVKLACAALKLQACDI